MIKQNPKRAKQLLLAFLVILIIGCLALVLRDDSALSKCGLPPGDQTIPTKPPKAKWELVGKLAAPAAPDTIGPKVVQDDLPSCFAHSPTGALFAAVNINAGLSLAARRNLPIAQQKIVLKRYAAAGPGYDAALARLAQDDPPSDSAGTTQVAGFKIVRYEGSSAVIDLAFRVDKLYTSGYVHATQTLRWEDGDWKLVLTQTGEPFDAAQQIPGLGGYVPWSGV
ncbi:MAG TPA: hypothetical protein VMR98_01110 [Candidatus Polarisedimenticolaceae bacterium]|nr:hypothetical protein [Candidatus Polarisedimenticolaceae bacterium]